MLQFKFEGIARNVPDRYVIRSPRSPPVLCSLEFTHVFNSLPPPPSGTDATVSLPSITSFPCPRLTISPSLASQRLVLPTDATCSASNQGDTREITHRSTFLSRPMAHCRAPTVMIVAVSTLFGAIAPSESSALVIADPFNSARQMGPKTLGLPRGETLVFGASKITPSGPPTQATATQGNVTVPFSVSWERSYPRQLRPDAAL